MPADKRRKRVLRLVNTLIQENPNDEYSAGLRRVVAQARMPMSVVLDKVPGENVAERARQIGISRHTYYEWFSGAARPSRSHAIRLERLTGISAKYIRGRTE